MQKQLLMGALCIATIGMQAQNPVKRVLLEEFTTTQCGFCPPVSHTVQEWHHANPNSIMITVHEGFGTDAMSNSLTSTFFNAFKPSNGSFAPALMIDRAVYPWISSVPYMAAANNGNGFDTIATRVMNEPAVVNVQIMNGTYDAATRTLAATVNATFTAAVDPAEYRINLYLVEDSIIGNGTGYDQKCYSSSFANTTYPGMFNGTYIAGYPHRYALRAALLTTWGSTGGIPTSTAPVIGTTYSAPVTYTVPVAYNESKLTVVAVVYRYGSGKDQKYALNAIQKKVAATFATGVAEMKQSLRVDHIYPVPASNNVHLEFSISKQESVQVVVTDIMGRVQAMDISQSICPAGNYELNIPVSHLARGIYYLTVKTTSSQQTNKIIVQ